MTKILCHHRWIQEAKDEVSVVNGLVTTRYTHKCPACGKIKVTERASRKLPPEARLKRELEKLMLRAQEEGYAYRVGGVALDMAQVTITPSE